MFCANTCLQVSQFNMLSKHSVGVLSRLFLQGAAPCPFLVTPCPFYKAEMKSCLFYKKKKDFFFHVMAFSSVLSFLLSTHSVDCVVPLLLSVHRVNTITNTVKPLIVNTPD